MKICNLFVMLAIFFTGNSWSDSSIPEGFAELFEFNERLVSIKGLEDTTGSSINLNVNYDTVKLPKDPFNSIVQLKNYFVKNRVSEEISQKILADLAIGIKNTSACEGYISDCAVIPTEYEFYYDYEASLLTVFINGKYLDKPMVEVEHAKSYNKDIAFINHVDLFANIYNESTSSFALNNKSIQGLPYGHITSDFTVSDSVNKFYELSYDVSFNDNNRLYVGQFNNGVSFNSTNMISPTRYIKQTSVNYGTTNNLILNNERSYERLYYFAPSAGELRITREGRVIKQQSISGGQGFISYSEMPTGRYDIEIQVVVAGTVVSSEKKTIFNETMNIPNVGEGDFLFTAGLMNGSRSLFTDTIDFENNDIPIVELESNFNNSSFFSALYSNRLLDSLVVAGGGLISNDSVMAVIGSQWYLPMGGSLNSSISMYSASAISLDLVFATQYFSVQYERFDQNESGDTLAAYLMGALEYKKISGNLFYTFDNGINTYYTYSRGSYQSPLSRNVYTEYGVSTIGAGYNLPYNTRVDITVDYDHVTDNNSFFLTLQIPFGSKWETKLSAYNSSDLGNEFRGRIVRNDIIDYQNVNSSLELASVYSDSRNETINEAHGQISAAADKFRAGANMYTNSDGNYGISGNLSSSQIITNQNIHFINLRSDAYAIVDSDIKEIVPDGNEAYGFVTIRKNNKLENKQFIYDDSKVIPISTYDSYNINIDTESVSLHNKGDLGFDGFTYPGSVVVIKPKLKPVVTFVSSFSDVFDEPVEEVECKGFGCIDVTKLMDGVFRVTLMEGTEFALYAGLDRCLVPSEYANTEYMNFGDNYCLPDAIPRTFVRVPNKRLSKDSELYYVGTFDDSKLVQAQIKQLTLLDSKIYERKIGSDIALYLLLDNKESLTLSSAQQSIIDSIQLYAKENHSLDVINQPLAMRENSKGQ